MNKKTLDIKYADLLLKKCLPVKASKSLLINIITKEHLKFAQIIKKRANAMGIFDVVINVEDIDDIHDYLMNTKLEDIKLNPLIDRTIWNEYALKKSCLLFIDTQIPYVMDDIEPEKKSKMISLRLETVKYYRDGVAKYLFPWSVISYPNQRWADLLFPDNCDSFDMLYSKIIQMCMLDKEDPVMAWDNYMTESNYYKQILNSLEIRKLHYNNSLGTNLNVTLPENFKWINLSKIDANGNPVIVNMPSYEIFTSPDYRYTEGTVYGTRPLIISNDEVDKFFLEFHDGKVINFKAEVGENVLKRMFEKYPTSRYLGEIALVNNDSPISNTGIIFRSTLFDENASCHLAFGNGKAAVIPNGQNATEKDLLFSGINVSPIHADFMIGTSDLEIEAETKDGSKMLIFKKGNFNI